MNQVRNRLAALSLLDRALATTEDDDLESLIGKMSDELRTPFDQMVAMASPEPGEFVAQVRSAAQRGRMNGTLERIALVLTDPCLADCIEQLGDAADNPSEDDLQAAIPGLIERHGLSTVRLMLASTVAGEAAAAATCIRLLKHDPVVALPPAPVVAVVARVATKPVDDPGREAVLERRRQDKARKQAEQRSRRQQVERARRS